MRYLLVRGLVLIAVHLAFLVPVAGAQSTSVFDNFSLTPGSQESPTDSSRSLDSIVAVVGEGVILASELDAAIDRIRARAGARVERMPRDLLRSQILDQLIITRLQVQRARQRGLTVSDADVDDGLARIARQNEMSMSRFTRAVAADGMGMQALREQVREELLISKLRRSEVMSQVMVTDNDVDRYLENQSLRVAEERQYRIRHILVAIPDDIDNVNVPAARRRIDALRQRIVDNEAAFAAVARANSDGQNAVDGGDLGWIDGAYMPDLFNAVLPGMQPGEVSEAFRGPGGFHLIKLEDVRGSDRLAADEKVMINEVSARHIRLTPNEIREDQRTRNLARQIRKRLDAGDNFAALAREYSDDSATANQGGELGWVQPQRLDPATQRQLAALAPGEVSPIFQTREGYEIVKVEDRRQRDQTREAIRNRARQALGKQKAEEEGQLWLRKLRDEAYVDIRMQGYQATNGS